MLLQKYQQHVKSLFPLYILLNFQGGDEWCLYSLFFSLYCYSDLCVLIFVSFVA